MIQTVDALEKQRGKKMIISSKGVVTSVRGAGLSAGLLDTQKQRGVSERVFAIFLFCPVQHLVDSGSSLMFVE